MDEPMLIKKNKRNSTSFLLVGILLMTLTLGISFSFFYYNKQLENDIQIIAGSVYLEANYQDDVTLSMMYPMSDEEGIENGAKYQLNIRGHNEFEKDLYYGIYLNQGVEQEGKIRLKDDEIKVYLTKTQDKETKVVYGPGTLKDFNDKLIHTSVINEKTNRDEEVSIDYELTLWVDEKVLISNTIKEEEGRRIYTQEEFANSYATVVPTVKGDYKEKDVDLDVNAIGILTTSNKEYDISKNYYETEFTDENVKVEISSEKEVSKFVITNAVTNEIVEKEPTIVNGKSIVELEYTESGSYVYYGVYEDGTTSEIDTYNIKIDKNIPTFVMETGKVANVENSETFYKIENKLTIEEENNYEVFYALVEKGKEVEEYNKIELDEENKIVVNTKSGLWDLVVKVKDEAKKEKVLRETYTISYTVDIINNNSDVNLERTTQKLVLGQTFNYIEELPVITNSDFIGYATDSKGINLIKEESIVKPDIQKIYAIYQDIGLIVKPTNNSCLDIVYNGEEQVLTKDASNGYVFNQNTGINAGSYTVVASLKEGYTWKDNTTEDVEITCNIEKVNVTYKADDANKVYDGTALTKQTATLKSGSLVNGHTATFTIEGSITNPGTETNTLKEVIIKNASGNDVTENYEITKENGTLTITSAKAEIPTNSLCVSRTYTGNEQQLTSVTNGTGYTLSGYNQINAGNHTITATLANGYVWSDDTTGTKTFTCSITYETYNVTLNNQSAESAGTTTLYGRYADGVYLDSSYSNKVTTSANAITIPTKTGYTFDGYYTSENGEGTQLINASGNITNNFTTSLYNSDVTLYAKWTANSYEVTYNGNKFNTALNQTSNGLTLAYDPETSYLTINGTPITSINVAGYYEENFEENEQYKITLDYVSGSYTNTDAFVFATDVVKYDYTHVSTRNYIDVYLPSSGSASGTLTINSAGANEGVNIQNWLWFTTPSTTTFNNYKVKVNITKVDTKQVTYNDTYGTLGETPVRNGYTFNGWYTSETGGTQVTSSTKVTNASNHTLYAQWTSWPTAEIPTDSLCISRTYNGSAQQLTSETSGTGYTLSGYSQTNVGTHTITATLANGYKWSDNTLGTKTFTCSIDKGVLSGGSVKITGEATYGETLTAAITDTSPQATYTYQWYISDTNSTEGGTPIEGATSSTLGLISTEYNKYVYVVVTATKDNYTTKTFSDITDATANTTAKVAKRKITVTAGSKSKVYDGTALTDNSCTLTGGTTAWGHTISSCTMTSASTITNVGSVNNVIDTVTLSAGAAYYEITKVNGTLTVSKATLGTPTNLAISTDGKVTWSSVTGATGYQISIDGTNYTSASSGIDYNSTITSTAGSRTVYVRAITTNTNYTTPSSVASKAVTVYTLTLNKGTGIESVTGAGKYIAGRTVTISATASTGYTWSKWSDSDTKNPTTVTLNSNATYTATATANTYTVTYDYENNIYDQNTSNWSYDGSSAVNSTYTYNDTTGVAVYSNASQWTGVRIPLNSDKKTNTNYELSLYMYSTKNFDGYLRAYATTWNESGGLITYNHGINVNISDLTTNTWKKYSYKFNSGNYSKWERIFIDYDTANQGPVYVSDIRLDEYTTANVTYNGAYGTMPTPTRAGYTFNGWYTSETGGTQVTASTNVTNASNHTLYAQWTSWPTATIPTNSLCVSRTYTGAAQQLTSATSGTGYTLSGYSQTNAGTYTITATLASGYKWTDGTLGTKTFTCSMAPKSVTYKADSASKVYDGTALTKQSATLVSGSLVSDHTATFSITGSQISVGSSTNTLNSVTIKDSSGNNVTSNYNITKENGTLTVNYPTLVSVVTSKLGTDGLVAVNTDGALASEGDEIREYRYSGSAKYCTYTVDSTTYSLAVEGDTCPNACVSDSFIYIERENSNSDVVINPNQISPIDGDVDNYIWFNNEMWRIIGVFTEAKSDGTKEELVKIIREVPLTYEEVPETYTYNGTAMTLKASNSYQYAYISWNYTNYFGAKNGNDWITSPVQYYLNDETSGASSYYNSINPTYQEMIEAVQYDLGNVDIETTASATYEAERSGNKYDGNESIWNGKVGMMYPSDYAYAASLGAWSVSISNYGNINNVSTLSNWMNDNIRAYEWTISPSTFNSSFVAFVYNGGFMRYSACYIPLAVSPVLYLKSDVMVIDGTGDEDNPYTLSIQ